MKRLRASGLRHKSFSIPLVVGFCVLFGAVAAKAQIELPTAADPATQPPDDDAPQAPTTVEVDGVTDDGEIRDRLERILQATGWFHDPRVSVEEGVVFLAGQAEDEQYIEWAGQLARNTQDVVAVVNDIGLQERPFWDFSPAWAEIRELGRQGVLLLPLLGLALSLLLLTWLAAKMTKRLVAATFLSGMRNAILRQVVANLLAVPVLLLGLYLVLKISGLTNLAVTVLGGTGLFGLVVGIAFRDIAENFLASILISTQRPFAAGDRIEVDGSMGFVQQVTTRGTLLLTFEGNHVHIPNSTIYKSKIINYTANPNVRLDFAVGIGYDDSIAHAQSVALGVLSDHPAVKDDPEPMALVESLGAATVNLRIYFWVDGSRHSEFKMKSSVIRLVKRALQEAGVSLPDEAREVMFPQGVPVRMLEPEAAEPLAPPKEKEAFPAELDREVATAAEGNLASEEPELQEQARQSRQPQAGTNLLET